MNPDRILETVRRRNLTAEETHRILRTVELDLQEVLDEAFQTSRRRLRAYRPYPNYPSISITGGRCELDCRHCRRVYLKAMEWAERPELLERRLRELADSGGVGCLISGGYTKSGRLPVEPFLDTLKEGSEMGLRMNMHPGLVDSETAQRIASSGVEVASMDAPGDPYTVRWVHGLDATPMDYARAMRNLSEAGVKVCPHVCIGLHGGRVRGELNAVRMVYGLGIRNLTFIILIPTPGTDFQHVEPPRPTEVAALVALTRLLMPEADIGLGCMRPRGRYAAEVERLLLRAGVDRVVLPRRETVEEARRLGISVEWRSSCCVVE